MLNIVMIRGRGGQELLSCSVGKKAAAIENSHSKKKEIQED